MNRRFLYSLVFLYCTSCGTTLQVFSDRDSAFKPADYKTYSWLDVRNIESRNTDPRYYNELTDKRIKSAVDRELQARGFVLSTGGAQLQLHYHIIVEDKTSIQAEPFGMWYGEFWRGKTITTYRYREGTLIIDMMDGKTNQLVWRGGATDVVTEKAMKDPETAIGSGIREIFKKFP
jgi:hypothetical protein